MANSSRSPNRSGFSIPPDPTIGDHTSIQLAAEFAYEWGWPLVNVANRANMMKFFLEHVVGEEHYRVEGWPLGYNSFTMQTAISSPRERLMCCPNAGLLYGGGAFRLGTEGAVIQVPQELVNATAASGKKIDWLYSFYDARSLQFAGLSSHDSSEEGFYLIVGPDWDELSPLPKGIPPSHVIKHDDRTELVYLTARIFMDPASGISDWLHKVNCYPAEQYVPHVYQEVVWEDVGNHVGIFDPPPEERQYVQPRDFFRDDFPRALKDVKKRTGEDAIYRCIEKLLDLLRDYPVIVGPICRRAAHKIEDTVIKEDMKWSKNGKAVGNGWTFSEYSGEWPVDKYELRTASAKSNLFQNRRRDTHYYLTDDDSDGHPLHGSNTYEITFEGGLPPAAGPCSLTVYSQDHFLCVEPYKKSIDSGTPNVITVGPDLARDIRTPRGEPFCLYLRAYWMDENKMPWLPPKIKKV